MAGEDAVKLAGELYLPRLDSQSDDEYLAYKTRASFFNASARTADGYVGLIFRREPTFKLPGNSSGVGRALDAMVEDADMLGTSLACYAKNVVGEVITVGRAGSLLDWEDVSEKRAFAVLYKAEQIINWQTERVNGRNVLTLVVLKETVQCPMSKVQSGAAAADDFECETIEQIRVLKLQEVRSQNPEARCEWQYVVEIWQNLSKNLNAGSGFNGRSFWNGFFGNGPTSNQGKKAWTLVDRRTPLRLGKPLPLIPFVFHGPRHFLPDVDKLPLADIIAVNLDHYRRQSRPLSPQRRLQTRSAFHGVADGLGEWFRQVGLASYRFEHCMGGGNSRCDRRIPGISRSRSDDF